MVIRSKENTRQNKEVQYMKSLEDRPEHLTWITKTDGTTDLYSPDEYDDMEDAGEIETDITKPSSADVMTFTDVHGVDASEV